MPIEVIVPELGESIVEATVARWLKQEGERVTAGEAIVELETEKVNLEVAAEQTGVLVSIKRLEGEDVQIGEVLGLIEATPKDDQALRADSERTTLVRGSTEQIVKEAPQRNDERATPVARRLAQEQGVDLAEVPHTGDRVTKGDIAHYLDEQKAEPLPAKQESRLEAIPKTEAKARPLPAIDRTSREERVRMSRRRQTIARRLVEAQQTAAMLTTFNELDMRAVIDLRQRRRDSFRERHGVKLGFMSFFVKATIGALTQFPRLNAEVDGPELVLKRYYDIGIAIGDKEGLVVPLLRDADRMSFAEIEQAIETYVQKSQNGTLSLEDLRGGTFTITNGGVFGSLLSTPILNPPQVGILGLHKIEKRPVALNDEVVIRPMMYVALSYDHRIVDGREAVEFLGRIKELIEDPETLLLEG